MLTTTPSPHPRPRGHEEQREDPEGSAIVWYTPSVVVRGTDWPFTNACQPGIMSSLRTRVPGALQVAVARSTAVLETVQFAFGEEKKGVVEGSR